MNFDFTSERFFDNHTHFLFLNKCSVTSEELISNFYHGKTPVIEGKKQIHPASLIHLKNQGIVLSMVHELSNYLQCEESLAAVVEARNLKTATPDLLKKYIKDMYKDGNIIGCMLDSELPMNSPQTPWFPCKTLRLYQYEHTLFESIKNNRNLADARKSVETQILDAYKAGFAGLKGHVGERYGFDLEPVDVKEAEQLFPKAKEGDLIAQKKVYTIIFSDILSLCGEIGIPIHLHSGSTGMGKFNEVVKLNPSLMASFLSNPDFQETKIVFLHAGYPFTRQLGMMSYNFPNIYIDLSQTLPWWGMEFTSILEQILAVAPHDKILLGSGQHCFCEISWLASKIAKRSLAKVMEDFCLLGLLSEKQAVTCAKALLSENAINLYKFEI